MRSARFFTCALCLLVAISLLAVPTARAAYTITIDQVGPDVVATGSGAINTSGLIDTNHQTAQSGVQPVSGAVVVGPTSFQNVVYFESVSGPSTFGSGNFKVADSGSAKR